MILRSFYDRLVLASVFNVGMYLFCIANSMTGGTTSSLLRILFQNSLIFTFRCPLSQL